jgi:pyruvate/2-oxoglutarate dehydrogenase complex dihydrolipoamide acyltransferase (E2) component
MTHRSEISIPQLSLEMSYGVFRRWLVRTGDRVAMGQPLYELETDDGIYEIGNFDPGIVTTMPVEGVRYPVGAVVGYIEYTEEERVAHEEVLRMRYLERMNERDLASGEE